MSELNSAIDFLNNQTKNQENNINTKDNIEKKINKNNKPFDIQLFENELYKKSFEYNKHKCDRQTQNITGYDICNNCIQEIVYKLRNTPISNYADGWLPIHMRTELGNATHTFIQNNTSQFTEIELNLKVPSLKFYGKIDYAIGENILGEIKSVPYNEYASIVKNQKPREKDFLQLMTYTYIINNYLSEIQSDDTKIPEYAGLKPQLQKYETKQIQFIYLAHDIISSNETESLSAARKRIEELKKQIKSKNNPFFFITTLTINLTDEIKEKTFEYIKNKFNEIHFYMNNHIDPDPNSIYINKKNCYFCLYSEICNLKKK